MNLTALILGTFASEDLTCLTAGLLVRSGQLDLPVGLAGCFLGIFVRALGVWLLARLLGAGLLRWPWLNRRLPLRRLDEFGRWFDRRGAAAIFAARFLPGTRVPLYLAAGALGRNAG